MSDVTRVSCGISPAFGTILILDAPGVSSSSCDGIIRILAKHINFRSIEFAKPEYFQSHFKPTRISLVVIPGGMDDSNWSALVGEKGMMNLKNYVECYEGRILGLCKGACFVCRDSHHITEYGKRIERIRETFCLKARADGPYRSPSVPALSDSPSPYERETLVRSISTSSLYLTKPTAVRIRLNDDEIEGWVVLKDGPYFTGCPPLAHYADDPEKIAIAASASKSVVAVAVHPEILPPRSSPLFDRVSSPENVDFLDHLWVNVILPKLFGPESNVLKSHRSRDDADDKPLDPVEEDSLLVDYA